MIQLLTVQEKAIKYAKKVQGSFLVRNRTNSVTCWSGTTTKVTSLSVEIVKNFRKEEIHDEYEYDGVKIYVVNSLILKENAYIFMLPKFPFIKPIFDAKGIEIKRY